MNAEGQEQLQVVRRHWHCCWLWPTVRMMLAEVSQVVIDGREFRVQWRLERPLVDSDRLLISERGLFAEYEP